MEVSASDVVYESMEEYAESSILHFFPSAVDGLTKVVRRLIWSAYSDRNGFLPLATLLTKTRILHVAGDVPIRTAADNHIQPWKTYIPIYRVEGTMGDYSGKTAGATRYIEAHLSDISNDLYFYKTNFDNLPMVNSESGVGKEPLYLIPMIPSALLNNDKGIGIGYRFLNTPLNINSVCELVKTYIRINKNNPLMFKRRVLNKHIVKHIIPDPLTPGLLRNTKQVYDSYLSGNFDTPLVVDGLLEVTKSSIIIKTIPLRNILNVKERIEQKELPNSNSWFSKNFSSFDDFSKGEIAEHVLTVKRGTDPFKLLDKVKGFYGFTTNIKNFPNWVNEKEKKETLNTIQLLELWYKLRTKYLLNKLRLDERNTTTNIRKIEALLVAADYSDDIYKIFKAADTPEEAAKKVTEVFTNLSLVQARYLFEFKYSDLTRLNKDNLISKLEQTKETLKSIRDDMLNIDSVILREVEYFKNKYVSNFDKPYIYKGMLFDNTKRNVKVPNFKYVCNIRNIGFVQCHDLLEVKEVFRAHGSEMIRLYNYPESHDVNKVYIDLEGKVVDEKDLDLPQTFSGKKFYYSTNSFSNSVILTNNNTMFIVKGINHIDNESDIFYVGNSFVGLNSNGTLEQFNVDDFNSRKNMNATGILTDLVYIVNDTLDNMKDYFIIKVNRKIPNTLFIESITSDKISSIDKDEKILYFGKDDDVLLSIIEGEFNRTSNKHLYFRKIKNVFNHCDKVSFNIGKCVMLNKQIKTNVKSLGYIKEINVI